MEDLENYSLVDGKPRDDVGKEQVTVVLGGWVLGWEGGEGASVAIQTIVCCSLATGAYSFLS